MVFGGDHPRTLHVHLIDHRTVFQTQRFRIPSTSLELPETKPDKALWIFAPQSLEPDKRCHGSGNQRSDSVRPVILELMGGSVLRAFRTGVRFNQKFRHNPDVTHHFKDHSQVKSPHQLRCEPWKREPGLYPLAWGKSGGGFPSHPRAGIEES